MDAVLSAPKLFFMAPPQTPDIPDNKSQPVSPRIVEGSIVEHNMNPAAPTIATAAPGMPYITTSTPGPKPQLFATPFLPSATQQITAAAPAAFLEGCTASRPSASFIPNMMTTGLSAGFSGLLVPGVTVSRGVSEVLAHMQPGMELQLSAPISTTAIGMIMSQPQSRSMASIKTNSTGLCTPAQPFAAAQAANSTPTPAHAARPATPGSAAAAAAAYAAAFGAAVTDGSMPATAAVAIPMRISSRGGSGSGGLMSASLDGFRFSWDDAEGMQHPAAALAASASIDITNCASGNLPLNVDNTGNLLLDIEEGSDLAVFLQEMIPDVFVQEGGAVDATLVLQRASTSDGTVRTAAANSQQQLSAQLVISGANIRRQTSQPRLSLGALSTAGIAVMPPLTAAPTAAAAPAAVHMDMAGPAQQMYAAVPQQYWQQQLQQTSQYLTAVAPIISHPITNPQPFLLQPQQSYMHLQQNSFQVPQQQQVMQFGGLPQGFWPNAAFMPSSPRLGAPMDPVGNVAGQFRAAAYAAGAVDTAWTTPKKGVTSRQKPNNKKIPAGWVPIGNGHRANGSISPELITPAAFMPMPAAMNNVVSSDHIGVVLGSHSQELPLRNTAGIAATLAGLAVDTNYGGASEQGYEHIMHKSKGSRKASGSKRAAAVKGRHVIRQFAATGNGGNGLSMQDMLVDLHMRPGGSRAASGSPAAAADGAGSEDSSWKMDGQEESDDSMGGAHKRRRRIPTADIEPSGGAGDETAAAASGARTGRRGDAVGHSSTSCHKGVTRHRWTGKWEAHLWDAHAARKTTGSGGRTRGKQVYLGGYGSEEEAARAYDRAALAYWGETATTNFPIDDYTDELPVLLSTNRDEIVAQLRRGSSGFARGASKYRGVTRHHQQGKWEARIGRVCGNKYMYLGTFDTEEEAARAYDMAAMQYRGNKAMTNFPLTNYQNNNNSEQQTEVALPQPEFCAQQADQVDG